jgi:hypothetical protein
MEKKKSTTISGPQVAIPDEVIAQWRRWIETEIGGSERRILLW